MLSFFGVGWYSDGEALTGLFSSSGMGGVWDFCLSTPLISDGEWLGVLGPLGALPKGDIGLAGPITKPPMPLIGEGECDWVLPPYP